MKSRKIFIVLIFFPACLQVYGQEVCDRIVKGRVVDSFSRPLHGAIVFLRPEGKGVAADSSGTFTFADVCRGKHVLQVTFLGYRNRSVEFNAGENAMLNITLEEDIRQLREVEVHGEILQSEHAHNYSTLNEQQLAETAGKSLGESLREISGVNTIQSGPGIFKPVIHGVHSQRILILNHGIRQEGQQWGAEHAPEIDPFIASDVVVIKDASSIKYGTDALGGVIIVNPPVLPERNISGGTLQTILQSNGRSGTVSGMVEGGLGKLEGFGWRVQGTAKRSGDFHTPDYSLTNSGLKELNFSGAAGYHHKNSGVEIFASRFQTHIGILKGTSISNPDDLANSMEREPPQYTTKFSYTIGEPRQEVSHHLIKVNGHRTFEKGTWRLQYGFQNNNRKEFDIRKGTRSDIPSINLQLNTHSIETEFETSVSEKRTFCLGLTGMLQENSNIPGTQRIPFIPNFTNLSAGTYAVVKFFFSRSAFDLGVRYDFRSYDVRGYDFRNALYDDEFNFHNASATAGLTVNTGKASAFSSNLSTAWRPPHVAELYSLGTHQSAASIEYGLLLDESTNAVRRIGDVSFKVEQALKWVNTFRQAWNNSGIDLTAYANYIFNYIYLRPEGITSNIRGVFPYFRYRQTDALFLGLDISGNWRAGKYITLSSKATLLRASDEGNNDYLVFIPANRYEIKLRYETPRATKSKSIYAESRVRFTAKQNRAPRVITVREINEANVNDEDPFEGLNSNFDFMEAPGAYWLWNFSAGISPASGNIRYDFRITVENILNISYREYSNRFRYYADEPGRNFIISMKVIF